MHLLRSPGSPANCSPLMMIAARCGISERQGRNWKKHAEIKPLIGEFAEEAVVNAKRLLARHVKRAAQALVFLLETRAIQEGEKIRYEFVHPPEVVRKAACDILQWAGIGVQSKKQSPVTVKVVRDTISNPSVQKRALKIAQRARSIERRAAANQK